MSFEEPITITPENYKAFDQMGREYDLSSVDELSFLAEVKLLISAYIFQRLIKNNKS